MSEASDFQEQALSALKKGADLTYELTGNPAVFAMLRAGKEEAALVVVNLSQDTVSDYGLSVETSSVKSGGYRVIPMLGAGEPSTLTIDPQGGFAKHQPLPTLPPQSYMVLQLQK